VKKSLVALATVAIALAGCGSPSSGTAAATTPSAGGATASTGPSHASPTPTATTGTIVATPTIISQTPTPKTAGISERQWAKNATATSSYGANKGDNWNASQAEGAPNASCGDDVHAWASTNQNTIDTLTLTYADRVIPSSVRVVQSFNPGRVSKIVVSGAGQSAQVYAGPADSNAGGVCLTLEVPITGVKFGIDTVAVTVNQSNLGSWAEIDAVELVGTTV
jgi:hypothetical protein